MRTGLFLLAGFLLLASSLILGRLFSSYYASAPFVAPAVYVALWFVLAGVNRWVGVAKAGYSVVEELPIFALIFSLPAAVGIVLKWKFL